MEMNKHKADIKWIISRFPHTFGLKAFPGMVFRISERRSSFKDGKIKLYLECLREGWWSVHTWVSESELCLQLVPTKEQNKSR
jgi:hypothetical protein